MSDVDFSNAHVVVTGGSSGIGRAFVRRMVNHGARVSVLALPDDDLSATATELAASGAAHVIAGVDVTDPVQVADAMRGATAELGPCDVLLTCAGITYPGHFERLDDDVFRRMIEVDYFGTLHPIRQVVPAMMERRSGSVVGISSAAGLIGVFGYTAYGAAKFAVRGLLEALRCELAPYDVHVACVCPPDTDTPQLAFENRFKPAETWAISGTIKPMTADAVAAAIERGILRRRFLVTPDWQTWALARTAGLLRGTYAAAFDRRVRAARSGRYRPPVTTPEVPSQRAGPRRGRRTRR